MNCSSARFFLLCILIASSLGFAAKLIEIDVPIIKSRLLPSASSDTRGFVRKGERYISDGETDKWYRIKQSDSYVWIAKEAAKVIEILEPGIAAGPIPPTPSATPSAPSASAIASPNPLKENRSKQQELSRNESTAEPVSAQRIDAEIQKNNSKSALAKELRTTSPVVTRKPNVWFSKFSDVKEQIGGETKELLFFQITAPSAQILASTSPQAAVLQKSKKGDYFTFIEQRSTWCKVAVKDTVGWIEQSQGIILSKPKTRFIDDYGLMGLIISVIIIFLLISALVITSRRSKSRKRKKDSFSAFMIAKLPQDVQCIITSKTIALDKFLGLIGIDVKQMADFSAAKRHLRKSIPDIVMIDWNLSTEMVLAVEDLFLEQPTTLLPLVIFYNMPDDSSPTIPSLKHVYFLGTSFSDQEVSRLVTPFILSKTTRKNTQSSAFEGDIEEGNLPEILQFIEIGKKTGGLTIETDNSPVGVIYFAQGRINHAAAVNDMTGLDAINTILELKTGKFRFHLNTAPKISDLNLSTLEVLMEWSKTKDETHRN